MRTKCDTCVNNRKKVLLFVAHMMYRNSGGEGGNGTLRRFSKRWGVRTGFADEDLDLPTVSSAKILRLQYESAKLSKFERVVIVVQGQTSPSRNCS